MKKKNVFMPSVITMYKINKCPVGIYVCAVVKHMFNPLNVKNHG